MTGLECVSQRLTAPRPGRAMPNATFNLLCSNAGEYSEH